MSSVTVLWCQLNISACWPFSMYGREGAGVLIYGAMQNSLTFPSSVSFLIINKAFVCTSRGSVPSTIPSVCHDCKVNENLSWHSEHTVLMSTLWSYSVPGSKYGPRIVQYEAANGFHWINITHPYFLSILFLGSSPWRWWMPVESPPRANLCTADYIKAENIAELTCCPGPRKADLLKRKFRVNVFHRYID